MTADEMRDVLALVEFENYVLTVSGNWNEGYHLQASYEEADIMTGRPELQTTRKWRLSQHMTRSELVQTAFKCCLTSFEHRAREAFKYRGRRVFGPHFCVDRLWELCGSDGAHDVRPKHAAAALTNAGGQQ